MGAFGIGNGNTKVEQKKGSGMNGLIGAGIGVANSAIGMIGQKKREERANAQTERLMGMQHRNQKELNDQSRANSYGLSMDLFNSQSQKAKLKQLEEAGLSAGLMYGGAGAGGSTSASVGAGSAASGSAAAPQQMPSMLDVRAISEMALLKAKKENIEADTENKREGATGQGYDNRVRAGGIEDRVEEERLKAQYGSGKARSDIYVNMGHENDAMEWNNGEKMTRYEASEAQRLRGSKTENLMKQAQTELAKATASNLISNDELIQLQTDVMKAQTGIINSDGFKKLPTEVQAVLLMLVKRFGGM